VRAGTNRPTTTTTTKEPEMTATMTPAPSTSTTNNESTSSKSSRRSQWRSGLAAGACAAVATAVIAAVASAAGVSLEIDGEAIPAVGFAQLTLVCSVVGIMIARSLGKRASRPRSTFTRTTVVLTAVSVVPDLIAAASAGTKATLILTHLVAAAIVIPALSRRLSEGATR
jgi:FtsH-binding integral membrane protein